jgi:hypothetical protein
VTDRRRRKERFIRGIFNYCDRWCERCPMTARCRVFARMEPNSETCDVSNEEFWRKLHKVFEQTKTMIREAAERNGIDLDAVDISEELAAMERGEAAAEIHPCSVAAKAYAEAAGKWLQSASAPIAVKEAELSSQLLMALPGAEPETAAAAIRDALEVIQYHQHQIWVKLMRTLDDPLDDSPEEQRANAYDADGSAKVALIAVDRSIASWGTLLEHFPDQEKELLDLLAQLARLRKLIESAFPNARAFVRPGFDDQPG